ncbi:MAG: hypothetical protein RR540_02075 [Oscillospiraceae bacterium]
MAEYYNAEVRRSARGGFAVSTAEGGFVVFNGGEGQYFVLRYDLLCRYERQVLRACTYFIINCKRYPQRTILHYLCFTLRTARVRCPNSLV